MRSVVKKQHRHGWLQRNQKTDNVAAPPARMFDGDGSIGSTLRNRLHSLLGLHAVAGLGINADLTKVDACLFFHKQLRRGRALLARILVTGSISSTQLANTLINLYAKCSHFSKANLVFDTINNKDVVSWSCLINAFSQQQSHTPSLHVMHLFCQLTIAHKNVVPNTHTFVGFFTAITLFDAQALAIKIACSHDVFAASSLLNMYCKTGFVSEAHELFDEMPERNVVSWATMIFGYASQELTDEALELFELVSWKRGQK
ncbi:tRNA pseudouridine synthase A isoform C [Glycine soja]|uniref:tRNA pseudouridine synthase A isoform C n=1 Tax=Glycine soja TaxID=3848 RepID=A0A445G3I6_GLYSO|nr:tRNA pseudouridine synthase A isoform C [Glycine soja]